MSKSTEPNIPLMRKALEWVEEQAELPLVKREWYQGAWRTSHRTQMWSCGTAYCVAGYICEIDPDTQWASNDWEDEYFDEVLATPEEIADGVANDWEDDGLFTVRADVRAASLLGLHPLQADPIWNGRNNAPTIRRLLEQAVGEPL